MRATLRGVGGDGLMRSAWTYCALVVGALMSATAASKSPHGPGELVALRGDGVEGVPGGLVRAVGAKQAVVVELVAVPVVSFSVNHSPVST